jgi:hypothetical protein
MALFTDPGVITLDNLLPYEGTLAQIAAAHNINVDTKIALATNEIGERIRLWLLAQCPYEPMWFNPWLNRALLALNSIVITPSLERWLCMQSLSKVFAEAYNLQLNTRFQAKWTEYQQEADRSAEMVFRAGLGIVFNPLPRPPMPLLSVEAGSLPAQSIYIQTTWIDSKGNESTPSPETGFILGNGSNVTVAILPNTDSAPQAAVGWNVYGSTNAGALTKQNNVPIAIGSTWRLPESGFVYGTSPGNGQRPDYYLPLSRQLQRG